MLTNSKYMQGIPECLSESVFNDSQLSQSGIGILALGTVRYSWSLVSPRMASYPVMQPTDYSARKG
jgi:hypothetical protein